MGSHALQRGYECTLYTFNLHVFDPTWFVLEPLALHASLEARREHVGDQRARDAIDASMPYLELGGEVRVVVVDVGIEPVVGPVHVGEGTRARGGQEQDGHEHGWYRPERSNGPPRTPPGRHAMPQEVSGQKLC